LLRATLVVNGTSVWTGRALQAGCDRFGERRINKHYEATIAQPDATLKRAKDHVESQIAALDAAAAAAAEAAADAHA
jgi:hypothetical protein